MHMHRMIKYKYIVVVTIFLLLVVARSSAQPDTVLLSYTAFIQNVLEQHPVARQAALQQDFARAQLLAARGQFDPILSSGWDDKYFGDKHYYRIFDAGFQIPTWYGLSVLGAYENTSGVYLNPENTTSGNGLWSLGLEANLLQGLVIDERRAALRQARIYRQAAENERNRLLNEVLNAAAQAYVRWQAVFYVQAVIDENILLAREYLEATRQSFLVGDKPAIDTLEAFLILQDRQMLRQENELEWVKARQNLENFLWYEQVPLELQANTRPEDISASDLNFDLPPSVRFDIENHPDLLEKYYKKTQYEVEQQLKRDKLKPKLKVKYNPLFATSDNSLRPEYSINNYKWGFGFSMPLLLRSERAALQKTTLTIAELDFSIQEKRNSLQNKVDANRQIQNVLEEQFLLQQQNVRNYQALLEAEREKFALGESSVFLLNKRSEKYLETQIKLIELQAKRQLARIDYLFLTGTFPTIVSGLR